VTRKYYSWGDAISALGGIAASFKVAMGTIAGLLLFKFTMSLANMIRRQSSYRYCNIIISIYSRYLDKLIEKMKKEAKTQP
jgi:sulfite exporter TauE/SafE